jgi:hypothetical protein
MLSPAYHNGERYTLLSPAYNITLHTYTHARAHTHTTQAAGRTITVYDKEEQAKGRIRCRTGAHPCTSEPLGSVSHKRRKDEQMQERYSHTNQWQRPLKINLVEYLI